MRPARYGKSAGFGNLDADGSVFAAAQRLTAHARDGEAAVPRDHHFAVAQIAGDAEAPRGLLGPADLRIGPTPRTRELEAHASIVTPVCKFSYVPNAASAARRPAS